MFLLPYFESTSGRLGRGCLGRLWLRVVVVVVKLFVGELFLKLNARVFAAQAATFSEVPPIRVRRNAHRKKDRVPGTVRRDPYILSARAPTFVKCYTTKDEKRNLLR